VDSLGIYSSRRELYPELGKGQHAQQHANMNADEHADAEQEWEGPNHGSRPHPLLLAPDGGRTGQAVITQPMNYSADMLQLEAISLRGEPSVPTLAKAIIGDPPAAAVSLGPQAGDECRCLACHRAIALVANGQ
jgi:hypothetical protein